MGCWLLDVSLLPVPFHSPLDHFIHLILLLLGNFGLCILLLSSAASLHSKYQTFNIDPDYEEDIPDEDEGNRAYH